MSCNSYYLLFCSHLFFFFFRKSTIHECLQLFICTQHRSERSATMRQRPKNKITTNRGNKKKCMITPKHFSNKQTQHLYPCSDAAARQRQKEEETRE